MEWMRHISWPDLLVVIIVLRSTYMGSQRGFFGELFHIFGICLGIILGIHFYIPVSDFINTYLFIPLNITYIIGFLLIIITIYLAFRFIYAFARRIIKVEMFPAINKIGGPIIGFCKGSALSIFLFFIMLLTPIHYISESAKTRSLFAPFFIKIGTTLYETSLKILPDVEKKGLEQLLKGVKPIEFKEFRFKKRDKLDEILE